MYYIEFEKLPKSCRECPCCHFEGIYFYCGALKENFKMSFGQDKRKENCPIKDIVAICPKEV